MQDEKAIEGWDYDNNMLNSLLNIVNYTDVQIKYYSVIIIAENIFSRVNESMNQKSLNVKCTFNIS